MVVVNTAKACVATYAAVAVLRGNITGTVTFLEDSTKGTVMIRGEISGLKPNEKHGFHIHEFGDITAGDCTSAGPHFNPLNKTHGAPEDKERHVGDLGNILANDKGVAMLNITDTIVALHGRRGVVGRSVVVHVGEDDYGKGGQSDSKTTGHAGARAGCGVIGFANVTAALAALD